MAVIAQQPAWEPVLGFDHEKAVQIIAFFLRAGGSLEKLKLVKLLYLSDRLSLQQRGRPLNFDEYYSFPHGPVVSGSLNGMNGKLSDPAWEALSMASDGRAISLVGDVGEDRLSVSDKRVLQTVWKHFGQLSSGQIRNWTHENCTEYVEIPSGRIPITLDEILSAVGREQSTREAHALRGLQGAVGSLARASAA